MINKDLFKGAYTSKGLKQSEVAEELGMTPNTLRRKIRKNTLEIHEVDKLIELLDIKDPLPIFFAEYIT